MKRLILILLLCLPLSAELVTITGTLANRPDGTAPTGTIQIHVQNSFTNDNNERVRAGLYGSITVGSGGSVSASLWSSDSSYRILYFLSGSTESPRVAYWTVPSGSATANLEDIETDTAVSDSSTVETSQISTDGAVDTDFLGFDGSSWDPRDISDFTADASPDSAADFVMVYDTSASAHKKVLLDNLPGGGGSGDVTAVGDCASGNCFQTTPQNQVLAGPAAGGAGQATERALVAADIPDLSATYEPAGITESDVSDLDHTPAADVVGTSILDDGTDTPLAGEWLQVDPADTGQVRYRTDAEALSDIGAEPAGVAAADITDLNAGSDITADLEEETHATEHSDGAADEITVENLATACTDAQVLGGDGAGGVECQTDAGGTPSADSVGTSELDDDANSPTAGDLVSVEVGAASFDYVTPSAGTDVTADLEEETHAAEHSDGAADEITVENLATACTDAQVLGGDGAGGVECQTDAGGTPSTDSVGTDQLDDGADTPGSGEYLRVDTVDQAGVEYRTTAEVLSDIGAEGTLTNSAGLAAALSDEVGSAGGFVRGATGVGLSSANLDDTDASVEWEDATDLDASGALSADVVAAAEMADADHGQVSWSSGVASVDAVDEAVVTAHEAAIDAAGYTSVSYSATPTFTTTTETANAWSITLTGNVTSSTLTTGTAGMLLAFEICQDATGGRTFVWPTGFSGAVAPSPVASACTRQMFVWDGTNALLVGGSAEAAIAKVESDEPSGNPAAGSVYHWADTAGTIQSKDDAGNVYTQVLTAGARTANQFVTHIPDTGDPAEAAIVDADVPDDITIDLAATATALAANGSNCSANQFAKGVDASGAAESCAALVDADVPDNITVDLATLATTATTANNLAADGVDAITEIAAALKSGADTTLITGTAGTNGNCAEWNVDGDIVDSGGACGGGGGAPTDAQYWVAAADATLTNEVVVTTSQHMRDRISDETGTGELVFNTNPAFSTAISFDGANPAETGVIRLSNAEAIAWEASPAGTDVVLTVDASEVVTITGASDLTLGGSSVLLSGGALGTPSGGTLTNATGLPLTSGVTGILPTANGGTGIAYFTAAGPTTARVYTFPDAAATILYSGGALGTPSGGTLTNASGLPITGITAFTTAQLATQLSDEDYEPGDAAALGSATATFTNKTMDAEGTGVSLTTVSKMYFPAAGCPDGTTAGLMWDALAAEDPAAACVNETSPTPDRVFAVAQFDDDQTYGIQTSFQLPSDWTGNVDLDVTWRATDVTGEVVWQSQTFCADLSEATSGAWNSADAFAADTADATADDVNFVADSNITMTGCSAGDLVFLRLFRDPAHASDDLATAVDGVAELIGVTVTLRRAQ